MARIVSNPWEPREKQGADSSSHSSGGTNSEDTLISDFRPQNCGRRSVYCFKAPLCGNLLQQPQEMNTLTSLTARTCQIPYSGQVALSGIECQPLLCTYCILHLPSTAVGYVLLGLSTSTLTSRGQGPRFNSLLHLQLLGQTLDVERMNE